MPPKMTRHILCPGAILVLFTLLAAPTQAVTITTVPVGNAGNPGESQFGGTFGDVAYEYRIATNEVTNAQYVEFLNAVAALDTFGLYNSNMASSTLGGIRRFGSQGSYTYSVKPSAGAYHYANKPVVFVNWGDAARFANWLHNGQPTGMQNPTTTEDGAYPLNGAISKAQLNAVSRNMNATWFLASEDEWYKAAYYDATSDTYYNYPTGSDLLPNNRPPHQDTGNSANFRYGSYATGNPTYPLTDAGAYTDSPSPYGTFDQGGSVREWTEGQSGIHYRMARGGSWFDSWEYLQASRRMNLEPTVHSELIGFRVATVPEPGTAVLAIVGGALMFWLRKRPRRISRAAFVVLTLASLAAVAAPARAVTIPTVPVGNAGNAADPLTGNLYGNVSYDYRIGTTEVTNAQYAEFLNLKAASDPLGLYNSNMGSNARGGITRSGVDGSYTYAPKSNMADKPVNYVSWYDAIRFANWLNNGQGTGDTETGAYTLLGGTPTPSNGLSITRNSGATWFLTSEDEWYKAAYHQPSAKGGDSDNYWLYPTASNSTPMVASADSVGDISNPGANIANYALGAVWNSVDGNVTTVGSAGPLSESYYGTADQSGNVYEWNEAPFIGSFRGLRGGAFSSQAVELQSLGRGKYTSTYETSIVGFRVATVPEPGTAVLAIAGGALMFWLRKRPRRIPRAAFVVLSLASLAALASPARAVTIPTVPVGNAGNAADTTGYGAVDYDYRIGTTEVTNAQYADFLNSIAPSDPLGLYNTSMGSDPRGGITRSGTGTTFNPYVYAVKADMGNKPVNYVSWYDSLRFANWLHNGQGLGDTETGAYTLLGGTPTPSNGLSIVRNPDATWFLPSEDEWYKAAYHQPSAQGGDSDDYWLYPTGSNSAPTVATANAVGDISNPGANVANYLSGADWNSLNGNVTRVGSAGAMSDSFYGTADQGGNVWEWNEALIGGSFRGLRGGSFFSFGAFLLQSSNWNSNSPSLEGYDVGFRVATVPEPSTAVLALMGCVLFCWWKRPRRVLHAVFIAVLQIRHRKLSPTRHTSRAPARIGSRRSISRIAFRCLTVICVLLFAVHPTSAQDLDGDSVLDSLDNAPARYNPSQFDFDADSVGDVADLDIDGDMIDNDFDNAPLDPNPGQIDRDADGWGDATDPFPLQGGLPGPAHIAELNGPYSYDPTVDDFVFLSAAGSAPPFGSYLQFSLDLNNDGIYGDLIQYVETTVSLNQTQLQTFGLDQVGPHTIGLRVLGLGGAATDTAIITVVPEPGTFVLGTFGLLGLAAWARRGRPAKRRRNRARPFSEPFLPDSAATTGCCRREFNPTIESGRSPARSHCR